MLRREETVSASEVYAPRSFKEEMEETWRVYETKMLRTAVEDGGNIHVRFQHKAHASSAAR